MSESDIEKYKNKLKEREQELLQRRRASEDESRDAASAEVEDPIDRANSGEAREDAQRTLDREYDELEEVQDALARIEAGSYGVCETCGRPIEPARLDAVPWTRFCVKDAKQREDFVPTGNL